MPFDIQSIFLPSIGVDIVFNINSLDPYSRSSIIYDTDFKSKTIVIAQPITPLTQNTTFKEIHLSTIIQQKRRKLRVGLPIEKFKIIKTYQLANKKSVQAVCVQFQEPAAEINIRSAFRLPLSSKFLMKGKIFFQNHEFYTSRSFSIRDISLSGVGITVLKKKKNISNELLSLKLNDEIRMGIVLINLDHDKPIGTIPLKAKVARIQKGYSETHCLIGLKISALTSEHENLLNKFIHDAQIDELKRLSRRDL